MGAERIRAFIDYWAQSGGSERANYQLFLTQLAALIDAPPVESAKPSESANNYVFEKAVRFKHVDGSETTGFVDLYKRDCFVCEPRAGRGTRRAYFAA
jgi:hypothetical protein